MDNWWLELTEPHAMVIAAGITVLGAVLGVLLGWWLFNGRVKSLQDAVKHTEKLLIQHRDGTKEALESVVEQVTSTLESINTLRAQVADQVDVQQQGAALSDVESGVVHQGSVELRAAGELQAMTAELVAAISEPRQALVDAWDVVRAEIEAIAADPAIDGRTRAKYNRVDRRRYRLLLDLLAADGNIPPGKGPLLIEAHDIYMRYRNNRAEIERDDLTRLKEISEALSS